MGDRRKNQARNIDKSNISGFRSILADVILKFTNKATSEIISVTLMQLNEFATT